MSRSVVFSSRRPLRNYLDEGDAWNEQWTYDAGDKGHIEVQDAAEGEEWEDTGLLDQRGEKLWRITRYVRNPLGFGSNL